MTALRVEKVNALPGSYTPDTLYIVKSATAELADIYLSTNDGLSTRHIINRQEIIDLISSMGSSPSSIESIQLAATRDALLTDNGKLLINDTINNYVVTIQSGMIKDFSFVAVPGSTGSIQVLAGAGVVFIGSTNIASLEGQVLSVMWLGPDKYKISVGG